MLDKNRTDPPNLKIPNDKELALARGDSKAATERALSIDTDILILKFKAKECAELIIKIGKETLEKSNTSEIDIYDNKEVKEALDSLIAEADEKMIDTDARWTSQVLATLDAYIHDDGLYCMFSPLAYFRDSNHPREFIISDTQKVGTYSLKYWTDWVSEEDKDIYERVRLWFSSLNKLYQKVQSENEWVIDVNLYASEEWKEIIDTFIEWIDDDKLLNLFSFLEERFRKDWIHTHRVSTTLYKSEWYNGVYFILSSHENSDDINRFDELGRGSII